MKRPLLYILLISTLLFGQQQQELRAVKITNVDSNVLFTDQNIAAAMDYLASIGVNVVLPVVWNGAYTQYQSRVMDSLFGVRIHPQFTGRDPLERIVIEAHRVGIEVYPWFEYGFAAWYSGSGAATGGHILTKYPAWAARSLDGQICKKNGFDWMSAVNPDVQHFINALVTEVITSYDVDGVEFSDRIPALPVECGYDSVTVALYKMDHAGAPPPSDPKDAQWMRWRADRLNRWYGDIRAIVKARSPRLFVSSSPSIYPWSYQEYLQDVQYWIDHGIADHFIPQLYRYDLNEYVAELKNAVQQAGAHKNTLFPGILMNIGTGANEYVIPAEYLLKALQANRDAGAMGEAFFYYEGLRKNNDRLGDTLKATFYKEPAVVPERGGKAWRFPAPVVNEDDASVLMTGTWKSYLMNGFRGAILRTNDSTPGASLTYRFPVPVTAVYDVYIYRVPNTPWTAHARYRVTATGDTQQVVVDQSDLSKKGWRKLATVPLQQGNRSVILLDNSLNEPGRYTVADAAMLMINRQLSPDAVLPAGISSPMSMVPHRYDDVLTNYPNPFNPQTTFRIDHSISGPVSVRLFDLLGRQVATVFEGEDIIGPMTIRWNGSSLVSGAYIVQLVTKEGSWVRKVVPLR